MAAPDVIVIYGSSLFLTAVAATLAQYQTIKLIQQIPTLRPQAILRWLPDVVLYEQFSPPPDTDHLLAAGIRLVEIDTRHSLCTIYRHQFPQRQIPLTQSQDLFTAITVKE